MDKKEKFDNHTRLRLFAALPMVQATFLIDGEGFGDDFYNDLVARIRPSVYVCTDELGEKAVAERQRRADNAGAELWILKYERLMVHTSDLFGF